MWQKSQVKNLALMPKRYYNNKQRSGKFQITIRRYFCNSKLDKYLWEMIADLGMSQRINQISSWDLFQVNFLWFYIFSFIFQPSFRCFLFLWQKKCILHVSWINHVQCLAEENEVRRSQLFSDGRWFINTKKEIDWKQKMSVEKTRWTLMSIMEMSLDLEKRKNEWGHKEN